MASGFWPTLSGSADGLERLEVEDDHRAAFAARGEAPVEVRHERRAVTPVQAGHLADGLAVLGVDDLHAVGARHVEAVRGWVYRGVIPATLAAGLPGGFQVVA